MRGLAGRRALRLGHDQGGHGLPPQHGVRGYGHHIAEPRLSLEDVQDLQDGEATVEPDQHSRPGNGLAQQGQQSRQHPAGPEDDARGRQLGLARNRKGGRQYTRAHGEPDEKTQSHVTDPDSGLMKTSNEGFQQCYNAQVAVDGPHQLVVATDLPSNASDQGKLPVLLDAVAESFGK